jgi:hypothetical protein
LLYERLTEPVHLNVISAFARLVGSYVTKVAWDTVIRPHYAYGVLHAAQQAREHGHDAVTVIETGVADGEGLLNLCNLAERTESATGVKIQVVGFDNGCGMPAPVDHRDHPELYIAGDFPMNDSLLASLPTRVDLRLGDLSDTVPRYLVDRHYPIGFIAIDVDYYSSTTSALQLCSGSPDEYVPIPLLYFDDIMFESHNDWCGERLAISEFNSRNLLRKIQRDEFLSTRRIFKNARWLQQIYVLHVLDHPFRSPAQRRARAAGGNDYIKCSRVARS